MFITAERVVRTFVLLCACMMAGAIRTNASAEKSVKPEVSSATAWEFKLRGLFGFFPESYNRVDGLQVCWGFSVRPQTKTKIRLATGQDIERSLPSSKYPSLNFEILGQTERDEPGGRFGLEYSFPESKDNRLVLNIHSETKTPDVWRSRDPAAAIKFFLSGADRRYYYLSHGGEIGYERALDRTFNFRFSFYYEHVKSLDDAPVWTVLNKSYADDNPAVEHGDDYGFSFGFGLDRMSGREMSFFPEGWELNFDYHKGLSNDFSYSLLTTEGALAARIAEKHYLTANFLFATAFDPLPPHLRFSLGQEIVGIDTFDREFSVFDSRGDRMVLFQASASRFFNFPMELINKFSYDWSLDLIAAAGKTWYSDDPNDPGTVLIHGFSGIGAGGGVGMSCSVSNMRFGAYLATNLNSGYNGPNIILSVSR